VELKKNKKTKCVRISEQTHRETIDILGEKIKIGAYADEALREKNKKIENDRKKIQL
jgi:hypothetical protein